MDLQFIFFTCKTFLFLIYPNLVDGAWGPKHENDDI
jgi:hypothetical protein